jgi:cephalosporin-C deacetylase
MKSLFFILFSILVFTDFSLSGQPREIGLIQTKESGVYKRGEKMSVFALTPDQNGDSIFITVKKNNNQILNKKSVMINSDTLLVYEDVAVEPCSIIVEVKSDKGNSSTGMLVDPAKLQPGAKSPNNFTGYWNEQKKILQELPFEVKAKPVTDTSVIEGYSCLDVEINCTGPKPARGYFAKPEKASSGSLPVVILVHAAGVSGSWCLSEPANAMKYAKMGALCFDLNAHGTLNGQPAGYYKDLENGELKGYWLQGLTSREDIYYKGMYLRLLRTIEFLTRQPEWDGKRILVMGESQGGGQALVAAGLDKRVSAVVAIVPAMCDWFGHESGRMDGWPQPFESKESKEEMAKALPYFDAANILKGSKATIYVEIGLIDFTCPSTSVYSAINQAKGKKIINTVPYRPHQQPRGIMAKVWEEKIYKPRESFISDYLK